MHTPVLTHSAVLLWLLFGGIARGEYTPILLTSDSYNQDVIIEKTASPPLLPATTASMDAGAANTGFSWFERGYNSDWPAAGLPEAGAILVSGSGGNRRYQLAPSYRASNVILLDSSQSNATMRLNNPAAYGRLSVLTSSGGGGTVIGYTVHFQDGSSEPGTISSPDWIGGINPAWAANGRVDVTSFNYDIVNSDNPRLYSRDISLSRSSVPVISVDFNYVSGPGHNAIFALSGAVFLSGDFNPIAVSGYNQDVVVEATASHPGWLDLFTTATMENGAVNARRTWYETGYYPLAPATGLPAAGTTLISEAAPDHTYQMAPSYTNKNAVLLDAAVPCSTVLFASRPRLGAVSLLTASGHGPVTNICVVNHADGTSQTNVFVSPDWFDSAAGAFSARGCVSISTKLVTCKGESPKLFAVDLALVNTNSPAISLTLSFKSGRNDSHAIIFAVSGASDLSSPITAPRVSIGRNQDGSLRILSSQAGRLQSTLAFQSLDTQWRDEGEVAQNVAVTHWSTGAVKFFRVWAQ